MDHERLLAFENRLNLAQPAAGAYQAIGHGRFSTVFQIDGMEGVALKRLPLFPTTNARALYERALNAYHMLLRDTVGVNVVDQRCIPITNASGDLVLYIAQSRQPAETIADRVLAESTEEGVVAIVAAVVRDALRVWYRNEIEKELDVPGSLMGLDARLSNWSVRLEDDQVADLVYLDTGTPFFRRLDRDHLEPALFLSGLPVAFTRSLRRRYVGTVLTRYYDLRQVLLDLAAGVHECGPTAHVPLVVDVINHILTREAGDLRIDPIAQREVERYAAAEARYWRRYLKFSRAKRFTTTKLLRRRYHFLLP